VVGGSTTTTRDGRRRRSDAQRNISAIVGAAIRVLGERPRASMQEVADAAGLHRATVHRHFPTREDLLLAVRERALDEFAAVVGRPDLGQMPPGLAVEELTRRSLELGDRLRVYRVTAVFDEASDERAGVLDRPIAELMERAQRSGEVRGDVPPEQLAMAWGGLVLAALPRVAAGMALPAAASFVLTMLATPAAARARG
jgi:AcrR family transcriptional regulator